MLKKNPIKDNSYKKFLSILLFLLIFILNPGLECSAQNNTIKVYVGRSKGDVNYKIFGTNILVFKSKHAPYNQNSDYGAGVWNPTEKKHNLPLINLAKDCNFTSVRYQSANNHIWANSIGRRNTNHYGLDEFLQTCKILKAEPSIVLSFFTNSDLDSSNLISYLNAKADDALIKILQTEPPLKGGQHTELFNKFVMKMPGINWGNFRAINGHITPYNVKYFEIGNELFHSSYGISAESYAIKFAKFHQAMKSIDDTIKLGAVFSLKSDSWNKKIINNIKDKIDFGIIHIYTRPYINQSLKQPLDYDYLKRQFFILENYFPNKIQIISEELGAPLAVTEFNGNFTKWEHRELRYSLGTALLNAEIIKMLMKYGNNIIFANNFDLVSTGFGMIGSTFSGKKKDRNNYNYNYYHYYPRPNYHVYKMYSDHFGDNFIDIDVKCETYDGEKYLQLKRIKNNLDKFGDTIEGNLLPSNWNVSSFNGADVNFNDGILKIEFNNPTYFHYFHTRKEIAIKPNTWYKLSGYIKAEDYIDNIGFALCLQDGRGYSKTRPHTYTEKVKENTNWKYVETVYKTLPDAKSVNVLARRSGNDGPLKGKIFIKSVKLEEFIPFTKAFYLSVNASISKDNKTIYLMVINKNQEQDLETEIILNNFTPNGSANTYTLWGEKIDDTNESPPHNNVRIFNDKIFFESNSFKTKFKKHSLTAIEITGKYE